MSIKKEVYVISDLHLGGRAPESGETRGFQITTHGCELADFINNEIAFKQHIAKEVELVINGDVVDFLAEEEWDAFNDDADIALEKMKRIVAQESAVFDALRNVLQNGHRLTLLLGNHDLELTLPKVRHYLEELLETSGKKYRFIYDGEAYNIGEVLIEHGNRYDAWNKVDYNGLRKVRSLQSRNEKIDNEYKFKPPKGSILVEKVMNPVKKKYRFVDLLKPENETVLPILLALEPNLRSSILPLFAIYTGIDSDRETTRGRGEIEEFNTTSDEESLNRELEKVLGSRVALEEFLEGTSEGDIPETHNNERGIFEHIWSLLDLFLRRDTSQIDKRLPALWRAIRAAQIENTFTESEELLIDYWKAAQELHYQGGYKYVIFGHTHLARKVAFDGGGCYINTGTWADLMKFPTDIIQANKVDALQKMKVFIDEVLIGEKLSEHIFFNPTYAYFTLDNADKVVDFELKHYDF